MTAAPPRRFWQLHLSTALVLMFVAAYLVWINAAPSDIVMGVRESSGQAEDLSEIFDGFHEYRVSLTDELQRLKARDAELKCYTRIRHYGWPYEFLTSNDTVAVIDGRWKPTSGAFAPSDEWMFPQLAYNAALAILILGLACAGLEMFLRRVKR